MPSVEITLPEVNLNILSPKAESKAWQLAVAGGRKPAGEWLKLVAKNLPIYCADRGIEAVLSAGLKAQALYGDADSSHWSNYEKAAACGTKVEKYPREKDDTDLQLLLKKIPPANLLISGVWGGRFDHLYSNVFSLLAWKKRTQQQVVLADTQEAMLLLGSQESLELHFSQGQKIKALSLVALSAQAEVSLTGVHWPLTRNVLHYLQPYAISNEIEADQVSCKCYSGDIGVYLCYEE